MILITDHTLSRHVPRQPHLETNNRGDLPCLPNRRSWETEVVKHLGNAQANLNRALEFPRRRPACHEALARLMVLHNVSDIELQVDLGCARSGWDGKVALWSPTWGRQTLPPPWPKKLRLIAYQMLAQPNQLPLLAARLSHINLLALGVNLSKRGTCWQRLVATYSAAVVVACSILCCQNLLTNGQAFELRNILSEPSAISPSISLTASKLATHWRSQRTRCQL